MRRWHLVAALTVPLLAESPKELRLVTVDPAHFHAAQMHTGPLAGFSRESWIYAPITNDLASHVRSIAALRGRSPAPDHWRHRVYAGDDFFARMLADKRGDVVVLSGRNKQKIDYLAQSVSAGLHVLADKPWIIEAADFPRLQQALDEADRRGIIAYDCMTQRFDIAYQLQRELVNDPAVFGDRAKGTPDQPAVRMVSSHYLLKRFNGVPNLRPAWYFDIAQQGEALADVGTHVVDLTHWTLFPEQALDYKTDLQIVAAKRWPTNLTKEQYRTVTGEPDFPPYLRSALRNGELHYFTNNYLLYTVRGTHVSLQVTWELESPSGDRDTMLAVYRGGNSEITVSQGKEEKYLPEVYVKPLADKGAVRQHLERRLRELAQRWPGLTVAEDGDRLKIVIPSDLRIPDVEYFLLLADRFAGYIRQPGTLPSWEKPNML
ncbi:MAG TPA: putative oxidoreductase C-terminal domain-containing protein, partial [Bryobacteraceae bacterium]|nr:putative oxidoreductase C-terminal domain-containing protein [Bryobacteraceae bacterium]